MKLRVYVCNILLFILMLTLVGSLFWAVLFYFTRARSDAECIPSFPVLFMLRCSNCRVVKFVVTFIRKDPIVSVCGTSSRFAWFQSLLYFIYYFRSAWPPLWSSGQSSWLQIRRPGFDSWHYQIFWEVVGLERGPLSLVSTTEELLDRKVAASV
jgi:hypothetical protein